MAYAKRHTENSSPNLGEVREGEAAFRCKTIIARFPHLDPPPCWGRRMTPNLLKRDSPALWGKVGMGGNAALEPIRRNRLRRCAPIGALPPIHPRALPTRGSLPLAKPSHPSPTRGEGDLGENSGSSREVDRRIML